MKIPELLFGVATSDHQAEAFDPRVRDIQDFWEKRSGRTARGKATDFWNRYDEDIRLAKELGCRIFRFSISWARVEPRPKKFDASALDHYNEVISKILEAGMLPMVTLHHLTWPTHIQCRGGSLAPEFPQWFASYADRVAERFGQRVPYWITFNEPNLLVYGYIKAWWQKDFAVPPGYRQEKTLAEQLETTSVVIRNLFVAHTLARDLIHARNPAAKVGANPVVLGLPRWVQMLIDWLATRISNKNQLNRSFRGIAERRGATKTKVDLVIANLTPTEKRSETISFSLPYGSGFQRLLVKKNSGAKSLGDLNRKRVGFVRGSTAEKTISEFAPRAVPRAYETHAQALAALDAGLISGLVGDSAAFESAGIPTTIRFAEGALKEQSYAVGVAQGNPDLVALVNSVISQKPLSGTIEVTKGSPLERIRRRGILTVGINRDNFSASEAQISSEERLIAAGVAKGILNDESKIRFVPLSVADRVEAVSPWYSFLNPLLKALAVLTTAINSNWWHLGMAGKLHSFLCPKHCVNKQDFVGLDYYWGINNLELHRIHQLFDATLSNFANAPVDPPGLLRALKLLHRWFGAREILIIENGCIDWADGFTRADYLKAHVKEVDKARRSGVSVAAYICWSITSNREWGLPFNSASDFGLYNIELETDPALRRTLTRSAEIYQAIIREAMHHS